MRIDQILALEDPRDLAYELGQAVWERGFNDGIDSLNESQLVLFWIEVFFMEIDMGGLSSYFYNRLPDRVDEISTAVESFRLAGATKTADLLARSFELFRDYKDSAEIKTWGEALTVYDPDNALEQIEKGIQAVRRENISPFIQSNRSDLIADLQPADGPGRTPICPA